MVNFDPALDALSKKTQKLQEDHARVMAQIELRKQRYLDAMDSLKALGCDSVGEAQQRIAELEDSIQQRLEEIMEELE